MKEINVGIIGFGFMGKTHTFGYKTIPLYYSPLKYKINLTGVCDVSIDKAKEAEEMLGFEYSTNDPDRIFNDPRINVVDICTPNIFHKEDILKAIQCGKHIYCDKPLATSFDEANEVLDVLKEKDIITQMALQYRFFPATMRAKQLIEEGRIGKIMSFRACYLHSGSVDAKKPLGWKQDKKFGGGGVLFDLGSHVLDLIYHFLGEYDSVFANTKIIYCKRPDANGNMVEVEADDLALMIVEMKNGGTGIIEASKIATGTNDELRFEIHGDKGAVRFNLMDPNWLEFYDNTEYDIPLGGTKGYKKIECVQRFEKPGGDFPSSKFSIGWIRAHVHSLYSFLDCISKGQEAHPSFGEGAYIQYVMEKAYESADKKEWIKLK